jgi:hypothetical protein
MRGVVVFGWIVAPTRMLAKRAINAGRINNGPDLRRWNLRFQIPTALISFGTVLCRYLDVNIPATAYAIFGYFAFARVNELLAAFYGDSLDRVMQEEPRLPLTKSERINLLATGYVENIVLFGIIHLAVQALTGKCSYSKQFLDAADSTYFSAMTITTTGFGDYVPVALLSRMTTMYEAVIGIVFLALGLSSYLSFTPRKPAVETKSGVDPLGREGS